MNFKNVILIRKKLPIIHWKIEYDINLFFLIYVNNNER